jgi:hypothetical protein
LSFLSSSFSHDSCIYLRGEIEKIKIYTSTNQNPLLVRESI